MKRFICTLLAIASLVSVSALDLLLLRTLECLDNEGIIIIEDKKLTMDVVYYDKSYDEYFSGYIYYTSKNKTVLIGHNISKDIYNQYKDDYEIDYVDYISDGESAVRTLLNDFVPCIMVSHERYLQYYKELESYHDTYTLYLNYLRRFIKRHPDICNSSSIDEFLSKLNEIGDLKYDEYFLTEMLKDLLTKLNEAQEYVEENKFELSFE